MIKNIFLAVVLFFVGTVAATASVFDVFVNTTPIEGQSGFLALDFIGGTPLEDNTATISQFSTNATLGALTPSGDALGSILPGPGTLDDLQFFNEFLQEVTFGTSLSLTLDLTTNAAGVITPDSFALYLLNSTQVPYATSDPSGADSLLEIDIAGPVLTPNVYTSSYATADAVSGGTQTPEPKSFCLVGVSLAALIRQARRGLGGPKTNRSHFALHP
jgi:hypothetical protein